MNTTNKRRFTIKKTMAGVWGIHDGKNDSLVCLVLKGNRPIEHTEAMAKVMLDALNKAVEKNAARDQGAKNE